jgi:glycosyltransferase involved in cell wall biosynthesis
MNELKILKNKKILFVASYPPPYGGVSSFVFDISTIFDDLLSKLIILTFDKKNERTNKSKNITLIKVRNRINLEIIKYLIFNLNKSILLIFLWLRYFMKDPKFYSASLMNALHISNVANDNNIDTIIIFTTPAGSSIPFLKILQKSLKIYYCTFADPYKNPDFYKDHKDWFKKAIFNTTKTFSSSKYCANALKIFDSKINPEILYFGVDTNKFCRNISQIEAKNEVDLKTNSSIVLFVGRMEIEMGAENVLKIAKLVCSTIKNIKFVMVGSKGSLSNIVYENSSQNPEYLIYRENVSNNDLPKYYAAADIVIAPTLGSHACMGVSVKEAMASGKPTIVSNSGGLSEAIRHDIDGIVVPLNDDGSLNNELFSREIIKLDSSCEKKLLFGNSAIIRANNLFSIKKSAEKLINIITI